jgi:hypothetical protein
MEEPLSPRAAIGGDRVQIRQAECKLAIETGQAARRKVQIAYDGLGREFIEIK